MREMTVPFLILAAVTLLGASAAMLLRGLVHCALALAVAFAGIGALYLSLGAQFLGLAQVLVYVGAIAVLIVFAILAWAVSHSSAIHSSGAPAPQATIRQLGTALMESYVLPLEVIGLMLTAALIGAVIVAMKENQR